MSFQPEPLINFKEMVNINISNLDVRQPNEVGLFANKLSFATFLICDRTIPNA